MIIIKNGFHLDTRKTEFNNKFERLESRANKFYFQFRINSKGKINCNQRHTNMSKSIVCEITICSLNSETKPQNQKSILHLLESILSHLKVKSTKSKLNNTYAKRWPRKLFLCNLQQSPICNQTKPNFQIRKHQIPKPFYSKKIKN